MGQQEVVENPSSGVSERAIAIARLVVAALLLVYVATYDPPPGRTSPDFLLAAGLAIGVALIGLSLLQLFGRRGAGHAMVGYIVADGVLTMTFVALFAFDPQKYLFATSFGVVLEAATLLGLRAALVSWAALSVAYALKEEIASQVLDVPTEPVGVILRLVVLAGVALTTGSLVEANRAARAFSDEREETERLRDEDEMKTAFLAAVSHDLKNPLTAILGFSTTLEARLDRLPPERTLEFLGHITRSARKLEAMLTDLLDMDRISRGILTPRLAPTDMGALVRRIVEDIDLNNRPLVISADEIIAQVDGPKVERIVENLVTNALKYTPVDTTIDLQVAGRDGGVLIAVEDRGAGIPDEHKQKVFGEFHRVPGAEMTAKGTGVGLSLVARFAELHGGRAWVEDRPGGGASFRVFLPEGVPALAS